MIEVIEQFLENSIILLQYVANSTSHYIELNVIVKSIVVQRNLMHIQATNNANREDTFYFIFFILNHQLNIFSPTFSPLSRF